MGHTCVYSLSDTTYYGLTLVLYVWMEYILTLHGIYIWIKYIKIRSEEIFKVCVWILLCADVYNVWVSCIMLFLCYNSYSVLQFKAEHWFYKVFTKLHPIDLQKCCHCTILYLTSRTTVTSARIPEEDACHRARNLCLFSSVQKGTPGLTHKGCVLQRVSRSCHGRSRDETKYRSMILKHVHVLCDHEILRLFSE